MKAQNKWKLGWMRFKISEWALWRDPQLPHHLPAQGWGMGGFLSVPITPLQHPLSPFHFQGSMLGFCLNTVT